MEKHICVTKKTPVHQLFPPVTWQKNRFKGNIPHSLWQSGFFLGLISCMCLSLSNQCFVPEWKKGHDWLVIFPPATSHRFAAEAKNNTEATFNLTWAHGACVHAWSDVSHFLHLSHNIGSQQFVKYWWHLIYSIHVHGQMEWNAHVHKSCRLNVVTISQITVILLCSTLSRRNPIYRQPLSILYTQKLEQCTRFSKLKVHVCKTKLQTA